MDKQDIVQEYGSHPKGSPTTRLVAEYTQLVCSHLSQLPEPLRMLVVRYGLTWAEYRRIQDQDSWFVKDTYTCIAFCEDDEIALGSERGFIERYKLCSGERTQKIAAHCDAERCHGVKSLIHNGQTDRLVSGGMGDAYIKSWLGEHFIKRFEHPRTNSYRDDISCLVSLPNNIVISGTTEDNSLFLWHDTKGELGKIYSGVSWDSYGGGTRSITAMDEVLCISTLRSSYVILWDINKPRSMYVNTFDSHNLLATFFDFNTYALACDNNITMCDTRSRGACDFLGEHTTTVQKLALIRKDIISVSPGTAKIWDARKAKKCKREIELGGEKDDILALASSPRGDSFAVSFKKLKMVKVFSSTH